MIKSCEFHRTFVNSIQPIILTLNIEWVDYRHRNWSLSILLVIDGNHDSLIVEFHFCRYFLHTPPQNCHWRFFTQISIGKQPFPIDHNKSLLPLTKKLRSLKQVTMNVAIHNNLRRNILDFFLIVLSCRNPVATFQYSCEYDIPNWIIFLVSRIG